MAPHLSIAQHDLIRDMLLSGARTKEIAKATRCSDRGIRHMQRNMLCYNVTKAPSNGVVRPRVMTATRMEARHTRLQTEHRLYQGEMARYLQGEFDITVSQARISEALKSMR